MRQAVRLAPHFVEKVWGSRELSPWFPNPTEKIGEVWFAADDTACPLLIKFLFTTEPLSVQVHPNDDYAARHENSRGKTEMWHILRAEPGAAVAMGFQRELSADELRASAESGEIERLLNWIPVKPGDTYFTPAGTVHAIGAGIALCEIQQRSDVTYRLYDYGRPRELHLDRSVEVADRGPFENLAQAQPLGDGRTQLVQAQYFVTSHVAVEDRLELPPIDGSNETLIVLSGRGTIDGQPFRAGEAWSIVRRNGPVALVTDGRAEFLQTHVPAAVAC